MSMHYKIISFRVSGEYGHFRKPETTTSPLTFPIPPRPTIVGLLGAIMGYERNGKESIHEVFNEMDCRIGISIQNPIQKTNMTYNLTNTKPSDFYNINKTDDKGKIKGDYRRTQVNFELLKAPAYQIYFAHTDAQIFDELQCRLETRNYVYTPCLGLSQMLADVEFDEITYGEIISSQTVQEIQTLCAVRVNTLDTKKPVNFQSDDGITRHYHTETYPMYMKPDRTVTEYAELLTELKGNTLCVRTDTFVKLKNGQNIFFL